VVIFVYNAEMKRRNRWLVITAGLGNTDFENASLRLVESVERSNFVNKAVTIITAELSIAAPVTSSLYPMYVNDSTRGHGYFSWKSELVKAGLDGKWGDFEGVIWVDAGCEFMATPISKLMFKRFQKVAQKRGVASFTLATKEIEYTKRDLFDHFPRINPETAGRQIQTTWMFIHGEIGRKIVNEWFEVSLASIDLLSYEPSKINEHPEFVENRAEQSAFSMVCKNNQIRPMRYKPTAGNGSFPAFIKGFMHPIWTSRNRTGKSSKKSVQRLAESFFIQFYSFCRRKIA
jgi:hypothetical protein